MKIIDSHIHFWDPQKLHYEWLQDHESINKPYLPADLPSAGDGWEMDQLVFVQADCLPEQGLEEIKWVTELEKTDSRIQGIVAYAPMDNHNFHAYLEIATKYPLVKGVRQLIESEGPGFATQEHFVDALRTLSDYDLTFDICVKHHQLPDVIKMVEWCPEVNFVLDHMGKPAIKQSEINGWIDNIARLAALDNVMCKISGIITEAHWHDWTPEDLQPYINHVVQVFGIERLMFGGDYPVLELANSSYDEWVQIALDALANLSQEDKRKVFYENTQKFYKL